MRREEERQLGEVEATGREIATIAGSLIRELYGDSQTSLLISVSLEDSTP
jgi:hypothetical protein